MHPTEYLWLKKKFWKNYPLHFLTKKSWEDSCDMFHVLIKIYPSFAFSECFALFEKCLYIYFFMSNGLWKICFQTGFWISLTNCSIWAWKLPFVKSFVTKLVSMKKNLIQNGLTNLNPVRNVKKVWNKSTPNRDFKVLKV